MSEMTLKRKKQQKRDEEDYEFQQLSVVSDFFQDDPIAIPINANQNLGAIQEYDLKKGLSLSITTESPFFEQSSVDTKKLTTVISLKTLETTSGNLINPEEMNPMDSRLPLDLLCIIDVSGSMDGKKLETVKEALNILIELLSEKDRISLVTFDSKAETLQGLKRVTKENIMTFQENVKKMKAGGGTDILSGLKTGFEILKNRKHKNPIVSVFLLSDGQDGKDVSEKADVILKTKYPELDLTINTFGFGADHDSELLNAIAKIKDGSFYFIDQLDFVNECFVNALGGLLSIVGRKAILKLKLLKQPKIKKELKNLAWYKTYGEFFKHDEQNDTYSIEVGNLMNGINRDYVLDILIPKMSTLGVSKEEILEGSLEVEALNLEKISINKKLDIQFIAENEEVKEEKEDNELTENVVFNIYRVQVAELLENVVRLMQNGEYDKVVKEIEDLKMRILIKGKNMGPRIKKLVEKLDEAKENCRPEVYNNYGKHALINDSEVP